MLIFEPRYPGLISASAAPGGGTTDYAVDIFHAAVREQPCTCYLKPNTKLLMMYPRDAIRATLGVMEAPCSTLTVRTSYNISAMHFSPAQLAEAIGKERPDFAIGYAPDHRQAIAESWPQSVNDAVARKDLGWAPGIDLGVMVRDMFRQLRSERKKAW